MIKLFSSAALGLSVALALSAAPAQAGGSFSFNNGHFGVGFGAKHVNTQSFKKKVFKRQKLRRGAVGYTAQPHSFARNAWHSRATGHIDLSQRQRLDLSRIGR